MYVVTGHVNVYTCNNTKLFQIYVSLIRVDSPTNQANIVNITKEVYMAEKNKGNKVSFEDAKGKK